MVKLGPDCSTFSLAVVQPASFVSVFAVLYDCQRRGYNGFKKAVIRLLPFPNVQLSNQKCGIEILDTLSHTNVICSVYMRKEAQKTEL